MRGSTAESTTTTMTNAEATDKAAAVAEQGAHVAQKASSKKGDSKSRAHPRARKPPKKRTEAGYEAAICVWTGVPAPSTVASYGTPQRRGVTRPGDGGTLDLLRQERPASEGLYNKMMLIALTQQI